MNWKNRLTNYNFWISIFSAMLLVLQALKIEFDIAYVNEIFTAVLGLLVVIGIINDPTRTSVKTNESSTSKSEEKNEIQKQNLKEEKSSEKVQLPTDKKNETNDDNHENDIQTLLTKISTDLDKKIKELNQLNIETVNTIIKAESEKKSNIEEVSQSTMKSSPAAAEMDNPYVDVIN